MLRRMPRDAAARPQRASVRLVRGDFAGARADCARCGGRRRFSTSRWSACLARGPGGSAAIRAGAGAARRLSTSAGAAARGARVLPHGARRTARARAGSRPRDRRLQRGARRDRRAKIRCARHSPMHCWRAATSRTRAHCSTSSDRASRCWCDARAVRDGARARAAARAGRGAGWRSKPARGDAAASPRSRDAGAGQRATPRRALAAAQANFDMQTRARRCARAGARRRCGRAIRQRSASCATGCGHGLSRCRQRKHSRRSRRAVRVCAVNRILPRPVLRLPRWVAAPPALAHSTSTSYLLIDLPRGDAPVALRWDLSLHDIIWTVFIDSDYDGVATWQEILDARARPSKAPCCAQIRRRARRRALRARGSTISRWPSATRARTSVRGAERRMPAARPARRWADRCS